MTTDESEFAMDQKALVRDLTVDLFQSAAAVQVRPILSMVILCSAAGCSVAGAYRVSTDVPADSFQGLEEVILSIVEARLRAIPGLTQVSHGTDSLS
jgi:hypothetical protein